MITIKIRPFFSPILILAFILFSPAFASDSEFIDQPQTRSFFTNLPQELFCECVKHLSVPNIVRASTVSKEWYQMLNQEVIWKNIVQTFLGYEQYKDPKISAKGMFIKLMPLKFHFLEKPETQPQLPKGHEKSARLWYLMYGEEILDFLLAKEELNLFKSPMRVSVTAFSYHIGHHLIAGKVQSEDQNLPFLYLEKRGVEFWKNIFVQAQVLPVGYKVETITMISEDGTTFTGTGTGTDSQSSLWQVYFPDAKSFRRHGIHVFDYQECGALNSLNAQGFSGSQGMLPSDQFGEEQTTPSVFLHGDHASKSQNFEDPLEQCEYLLQSLSTRS